jgi:hypothetical protein
MADTANPTESSPSTATSTFILRFYREWAGGALRWRGRIEHLESGAGVAFLDLDKMVSFVRSLGIMVEEGTPGQGPGSSKQRHGML